MKIGAMSAGLQGMSFDDGLKLVSDLGFEAIEIACAGYFEDRTFADLEKLASSSEAVKAWTDAYADYGLAIDALAIHGQPLSPDNAIAEQYRTEYQNACRVAYEAGISKLVVMAGLPEGGPGDRVPNWISGDYNPGDRDIWEWQWQERVLPYWMQQSKVAEQFDCKLCFEICPADVVFNPRTFMRLREAVGPVAGVTLDPSHFWWQGMDVLRAMQFLGDAVYHVHVKDASVDDEHTPLNGIHDTTPQTDVPGRSWRFRTVGDGHDAVFWQAFVDQLRSIDYRGSLSVEWEDFAVKPSDGLEQGIRFMRELDVPA